MLTEQEKVHAQFLSKHPEERRNALEQMRENFSSLPDKQQAWNDLHSLISDEDWEVRLKAVEVLGSLFSQLPDKQQAWNDLLRLTNDEYLSVMYRASSALGSAFSQFPNKQQAWNDLIKLTTYEIWPVTFCGARALASAFSQAPDKQQAWNDLHKLTNDKYSLVRTNAAKALGSLFSQLPDKQQAWNDLHKLTNDKYSLVRLSAVLALGSAFSQLPDKQQAWNDLHKRTNDKSKWVRSGVAWSLGSAFSQVPDKQQAYQDLIVLAEDNYENIRAYANHSLGRVSIFIASQAEIEEDYEKELEKAIDFFEIAARKTVYNNPAQFCLPFYLSFHTIVFKKQEAKEEVNKYLEEAKAAIEGSENKKQLFEAVENLSEALKRAQNLENLDLEAKKNELNLCMTYCDRAEELIRNAEEKAPYATKVLRLGMPILKRNLNEILKEIQENAKIAYKESKGTDTESLTFSICKEVHEWRTDGLDEISSKVENIIFSLKSKIPNVPENKLIYDKIESLKNEPDFKCQLDSLSTLILLIPQQVTIINNILESEISIHGEITEFNNSFNKKIKHSIINSLGVACAAFTLGYPVCEIYSLEHKNYICIGVFALFFILSLPIYYDN